MILFGQGLSVLEFIKTKVSYSKYYFFYMVLLYSYSKVTSFSFFCLGHNAFPLSLFWGCLNVNEEIHHTLKKSHNCIYIYFSSRQFSVQIKIRSLPFLVFHDALYAVLSENSYRNKEQLTKRWEKKWWFQSSVASEIFLKICEW